VATIYIILRTKKKKNLGVAETPNASFGGGLATPIGQNLFFFFFFFFFFWTLAHGGGSAAPRGKSEKKNKKKNWPLKVVEPP
jgi:ATP-dependent Zn protease